jgi:hypothetical protein
MDAFSKYYVPVMVIGANLMLSKWPSSEGTLKKAYGFVKIEQHSLRALLLCMTDPEGRFPPTQHL